MSLHIEWRVDCDGPRCERMASTSWARGRCEVPGEPQLEAWIDRLRTAHGWQIDPVTGRTRCHQHHEPQMSLPDAA